VPFTIRFPRSDTRFTASPFLVPLRPHPHSTVRLYPITFLHDAFVLRHRRGFPLFVRLRKLASFFPRLIRSPTCLPFPSVFFSHTASRPLSFVVDSFVGSDILQTHQPTFLSGTCPSFSRIGSLGPFLHLLPGLGRCLVSVFHCYLRPRATIR